ncbi:MAG: lipid-A-disaccharide synthase, partial [Pseudomonadota bacterium]
MTAAVSDPARIFMLAGEPSGDMLGGRLIKALRAKAEAPIDLFGVGGVRMRDQGLKSMFPMEELSLIGIAEVLPHLPRLLRRLGQTSSEIRQRQPDVVLTIDAPGFALRLQRRLRRLPLSRVHYVAPQVWAWRAGRAARLSQDLDHLLTLLPFEPSFFERHGLDCSFVGHPIVEEAGAPRDGPRFRRRYGVPEDAPLLCLLPGSRKQELMHHLPVLRDTVALLWQHVPRLRVVLPTLGHLAPLVRPEVGSWSVPVLVLEDREERFEAYAASWLAIAASGTVSLETALAELP